MTIIPVKAHKMIVKYLVYHLHFNKRKSYNRNNYLFGTYILGLTKDCFKYNRWSDAKHSATIVGYSFATHESWGRTQKKIPNSSLTNKTPFQILFPIQLHTFFSPSGRSEWLVGASTPGWRCWGSPPGAPQLPSTNSLIQEIFSEHPWQRGIHSD